MSGTTACSYATWAGDTFDLNETSQSDMSVSLGWAPSHLH